MQIVDHDVATKVTQIIADVLFVQPSEIQDSWSLTGHLGAEGHDLLDLRHRIQKAFGVTVMSDEEYQDIVKSKKLEGMTVRGVIERVQKLLPA